MGSIGLPAAMPVAAGLEMLDDDLVGPTLPKRPLESNKGTFGKALALAGSSHYIGAAYLVCGAAARIGAGLVTLATQSELAPFYATMLPEITYTLLPPESAAPEARAQSILDQLDGYRALVVGPGLGQSQATAALLERLFAGLSALVPEQRPHLVVDADGLNNLAKLDHWWLRLPPGAILTPHPGEMARLRGGRSVSGGGPDRLTVIREAARDWGHIIVLKGACTLIASPEGVVRINATPNPALATAGLATCWRVRRQGCWRKGWRHTMLPAPLSIFMRSRGNGSARTLATRACWRAICWPSCRSPGRMCETGNRPHDMPFADVSEIATNGHQYYMAEVLYSTMPGGSAILAA